MKWRVPADLWPGRVVFVLGGGPSLSGFNVRDLRGLGAVIAVNDAGLDLAPWADMLYFADGPARWFGWNAGRLSFYRGPLRVSRSIVPDAYECCHLVHDRAADLSHDAGAVAGFCGGANALNIAYLAGAARVFLLGFDLRPGHWHQNHQRPTPLDHYQKNLIPSFGRMARALAGTGCEVVNATPGSALDCWPKMDPVDMLERLK